MLYFDLAALAVALIVFQGWLGGELVYRDGVFVQPRDPAQGKHEAGSESEGHSHHH